MAISSTGIGSGLNVENIITQLTALEKRPLTLLQGKAAEIQSKLSTVGTIKSQVSALSDAAFKLTLDSSWNGISVASTNSAAVTGTITGIAAPSSFSVEVSQLAKAQTAASSAVPVGTSMGTGTLTIDLGTWNFGAMPPTFPLVPTGSVSVAIGSGEDTLTAIAQKINDASAGVTATVLRDASGERLLVRSKDTGEASGFRITVSGDSAGTDTDDLGLSRLSFDLGAASPPVLPSTLPKASYGMAANDYQQAQNTAAKINGVSVSSADNTLADAVPGLKLQLTQVTTAPVGIVLSPDLAAVSKNISDFVAAYNALNTTLADATKYDSATKTAGILQGDSTAVGLQNALRGLISSSSSGSKYPRLADVGISPQLGGGLAVDATKSSASLQDLANLKKLFASNNGDPLTNGFGLKVKAFTKDLLASEGLVTSKSGALQAAATRNNREQDKVNAHVALVEARLRKQYSALDAQMGSLNSLNAFVTQQVTLWNKSTG